MGFYQSKPWRALRAECLRRNPVCQTPGCGRTASHADHILARAKGGRDTLANLQALCASCHSRKTNAYDNGFGRKGNPAAALRLPGCDASGQPLDPAHWWEGGVHHGKPEGG